MTKLMQCDPSLNEKPCDRPGGKSFEKCEGCPRCHVSELIIKEPVVRRKPEQVKRVLTVEEQKVQVECRRSWGS